MIKPRFGVLLNSPISQLGISATISYMKNLEVNENQKDNIPASFFLYYAKKCKKNGLFSK